MKHLVLLFMVLLLVAPALGCDNPYVAPDVAKAKSEMRQEKIEQGKEAAYKRLAVAEEAQLVILKECRDAQRERNALHRKECALMEERNRLLKAYLERREQRDR